MNIYLPQAVPEPPPPNWLFVIATLYSYFFSAVTCMFSLTSENTILLCSEQYNLFYLINDKP